MSLLLQIYREQFLPISVELDLRETTEARKLSIFPAKLSQ